MAPPDDALRQGGFTLLELVVVLVVLGLALGLVVARGPSRSATLELRAASSQVAQTLRLSRARAISTNRRVVFRLNPASHQFAVDGSAPRVLPASLGVSVVAVSPEIARDQTAGIVFAPDGSSTGGRIELTSGARRAQVDVAWLTGRVSVAGP